MEEWKVDHRAPPAGLKQQTSNREQMVGGQTRGSQGHWAPPRSLTSPTAFTTGRWRRPMVLNRLKTWETWVLGETVNGEGFIYGVTSCRRESKNHPQPGISMDISCGTAPRDSPPHHNHPGIQQCEIQVMYVRIPRVVLGHLRIRKAWLAGTLQFQPRHTAALQHTAATRRVTLTVPPQFRKLVSSSNRPLGDSVQGPQWVLRTETA